MGKILGVTDRNTNLVLMITDGTGELEVNHWLNDETPEVGRGRGLLERDCCVPLVLGRVLLCCTAPEEGTALPQPC